MEHHKNSLISKIAWFFTQKYRITVLFWVVLLIFGLLSYTTFLKREGFPPIAIPVIGIQGSYLVDDSNKIDSQVIQPIATVLNNIDEVKEYQTSASDNSYSIIISLNDDVEQNEGLNVIKNAIKNNGSSLPENVNPEAFAIDPSKFNNRYNLILSVYSTNPDTNYNELEKKADLLSEDLENNLNIDSAVTIPLFQSQSDNRGIEKEIQTGINRIGIKSGDQTIFYNAINIGVVKAENVDDIDLSKTVNSIIENTKNKDEYSGIEAKITSDFATTINRQIQSLQSNLIGGLVAVLVISLLLISWRAALVIAIFIPTVMAASFLGLNLLGYTLNTITLFALILTLGLFVDDATIIVEAIDAHRKDKQKRKQAIMSAVSRVGLASLAGTLTTIVVFTPMLYVSGILGDFIRLLPATVILSLAISFVISLVLVPFLSRPLVLGLRGKKKFILDKFNILEPYVEKLGKKLGDLPLLNKKPNSKSRLITAVAIGISILSIMGAFYFASKLTFDIFPKAKDSDALVVSIDFDNDTTIAKADNTTKQLDGILSETISDEIEYVSYQSVNNRNASIRINLTSYNERVKTSHQLAADVESRLSEISGADIKIGQIDAGPPTEDYPFQMRIYNNDLEALKNSSETIANFVQNISIINTNNEEVKVLDVKVDGLDQVTRSDKGRFVTILAAYDKDNIPSSVVLSTKDIVVGEFSGSNLEKIGLSSDSLDFEVSQQSENAQSFSSIGVGLIVALVLMYSLLVIMFNSFSQPLLIFLAIPFSLFGVFFGLWVTDNSLSFFVMVGLLGLIGVVVNNSILLTEYANQEIQSGNDRFTAISNAVKDRFRPLVTTTLTTIFALLPLSFSDPFWQPLAYTLIFGMLSSTIMIIISFPYYYIFFESIRNKIKSYFNKFSLEE
jgi:multidrug efflux pump subunit AcrB